MPRFGYALVPLLCLFGLAASSHADVSRSLEAVTSVGHKGEGHVAAAKAAGELSQAGPDALLPILSAMNDANPLAVNWLRGAFEAVASNAVDEKKLPLDALESFLSDTSNNPRARRLAYEWIVRVSPRAEHRIIPTMLEDPSAEMRRDAVLRLIREAKDLQKEGYQKEAIETYRKALTGASEAEQVDPIAKSLEELGEEVDLINQYGLLTGWSVIGPFDNKDEKGFPVEYPPENGVDLDAEYDGQLGKVRWEKLAGTESDGTFDIAALTEPHKGAIDYLTTVVVSEQDQPVEFRLATANAWKLWVNDELVFAREEYHRGMRFDQYRVEGRLKKGPNRILLKVCQNEQEDHWAQRWSLQFRIVQPSGLPVKLKTEN